MTNINDFLNANTFISKDTFRTELGQPQSSLTPLTETAEITPSGLQVSRFGKGAVGTSVLYRAVSTQISASGNFQPLTVVVEPSENTNLFDFEEVAKNVTSFVSSSILAAQARGESDEKLTTMFEQARTGVEQGVSEAKQQLSDINVLDDELSEGIEKSRTLIHEGINDLEGRVFPSQQQSNKDGFAFGFPEAAGISATSRQELYQANSRSSDLSITTADGDVVTISFNSFYERYSASDNVHARGAGNERSASQSFSSSVFEMGFSFSIDGELDDEEKAAIGDLIKDINKLQKEFFNGNIDKAFEKALELGFDQSQISSFNLDLQQTTTTIASKAYQQVATYDDQQPEQLGQMVRPVINFAEQLNELRERADELLSAAEDQTQQLMDAVFAAEFGSDDVAQNNWRQFEQFFNRHNG